MYAAGAGVVPRPVWAHALFRLATDLGNPNAQRALALSAQHLPESDVRMARKLAQAWRQQLDANQRSGIQRPAQPDF